MTVTTYYKKPDKHLHALSKLESQQVNGGGGCWCATSSQIKTGVRLNSSPVGSAATCRSLCCTEKTIKTNYSYADDGVTQTEFHSCLNGALIRGGVCVIGIGGLMVLGGALGCTIQ